MLRTIKPILILLTLALPLWQCKDPYVNPHVPASVSDLVVEGYISGNGPTVFTLSRSISLPGDSAIPREKGARVQVEGDNNTTYPLKEQDAGVYGGDTLALSSAAKYRLRITTSGGSSYLSDYVPYKPTPVIDSINWVRDANGVVIYANTHDPSNNTRYYQWQFDETWEYHSAEYSNLKYVPSSNTVVSRPISEQIFRCWHDVASSAIWISSSAKLSQDVIYRYPLVVIPNFDQKLSVLYTIFVQQYSLTEDGYNYLSLMKKNTESLGSIFDAQPSILRGNIHSLSNPNEIVVGYVSAGTVQQQRIYIDPTQAGWTYVFQCPDPDKFVPDNPDSLFTFFSSFMVPIESAFRDNERGYDGNATGCVDCRAQGGTTQKPSYWPL